MDINVLVWFWSCLLPYLNWPSSMCHIQNGSSHKLTFNGFLIPLYLSGKMKNMKRVWFSHEFWKTNWVTLCAASLRRQIHDTHLNWYRVVFHFPLVCSAHSLTFIFNEKIKKSKMFYFRKRTPFVFLRPTPFHEHLPLRAIMNIKLFGEELKLGKLWKRLTFIPSHLLWFQISRSRSERKYPRVPRCLKSN